MPLTPPPNPNDAQARADMQEYNAAIKPLVEHRGEVVLVEWHKQGDRTFTIDEVKRWFVVAAPLSEAARRLE